MDWNVIKSHIKILRTDWVVGESQVSILACSPDVLADEFGPIETENL